MIEFNSSIITTFTFYLFIILSIGFIAWRKTQTTQDYYLGGRKLSPVVAAFSAGASDVSGWVMLGLPGFAYLSGFEASWLAFGLCIGVALNWFFCARRLRLYSFALDDAVTIPVYLQRRFADSSLWLKSIAAIFILLFFLFYIGSGLIGGAKLFESVFGMSYHSALLIGAGVIVVYTLFGGFLAVSWTDVFQGLLMTLALVLTPLMVMSLLDAPGFIATIDSINPELLDPTTDNQGQPLSLIATISLLGWGLGYFGQPHILARFKAIASDKLILHAAAIGISWSIVIYTFSMLIGLAGVAYLDNPLEDSEKVFLVLTSLIYHPLVAGILLSAILAAIMSTVDSQLLVCSSALTEDLYPLFRKKALTTSQHLKLNRIAVTGIAMLSVVIASDPDSKVLDVVAYAWGGLGAALGPTILLSLYWKRMTKQGALAGIIVGGLTVIIWKEISGGIFELYELVPGFFFSLLAIIVISLLSKEPGHQVVEKFAKIETQLKH